MVAAGIFLSRIAGLLRNVVFFRFFGLSDPADAFTSALRIPNLLQNLFGEGALSASFIPVYAGLMAEGRRDEARRVAGAVAGALGLLVSIIVLAGVLATPLLIDVIAPGFEGETRELTITLVRILFPGTGILVLSAWCLGILNSHRQFFLSYAAPVLWNAAMIATMLAFGRGSPLPDLAVYVAWASVAGAALQFLVQVPAVLRHTGGVRPTLDRGSAHVRTVFRNFVPTLVSRGAFQISAFVDVAIATLLPTGAPAALNAAQAIYMLPVSLFGMSVSAAELPAMAGAGAGAAGEERANAELRRRLDAGLRQIAYFVVPSAVAFAGLGHMIAQVLYQRGSFSASDSRYVWTILAGSAAGLLASTLGRLYSSTWYALRDTRTPLRFALVRVGVGIVLGLAFALGGPALLGIDRRWGAVGLVLASGAAGWIEFALLRRTLNRRIGRTGLDAGFVARLWAAGLVAAGAGWGVLAVLSGLHHVAQGLAVLGTFGLAYGLTTFVMGVPQARAIGARLGLGGRRG
jgi:putative peptidoglycan lipid II flippase